MIFLRNPAEDELVGTINTAMLGICRFDAELLIYFNDFFGRKKEFVGPGSVVVLRAGLGTAPGSLSSRTRDFCDNVWRPLNLLLQNPCRSQSLESPIFKVNLRSAIVPVCCHRYLYSRHAQ